jgi:antirestriction protein ArdC
LSHFGHGLLRIARSRLGVAQCGGLPEDLVVGAPPRESYRAQGGSADQTSGIDFRIGGDWAFYVTERDYVQVPPPQAYFEPIIGAARRSTSSVIMP